MKRYLLFTGDTYYPEGGWCDFRGSFATVHQAEEEAVKLRESWHQVIDTETEKEVVFVQEDFGLPGALTAP